jgi:hypothetical protein
MVLVMIRSWPPEDAAGLVNSSFVKCSQLASAG